MNQENKPMERQETLERFPSKEEIQHALETILKGKKYRKLRVKGDGKEITMYEAEVLLEHGERNEYNYQKADYNYKNEKFPAGARFSASIHVTYWGANGMPSGGDCVANYLDGKWEYIPERR